MKKTITWTPHFLFHATPDTLTSDCGRYKLSRMKGGQYRAYFDGERLASYPPSEQVGKAKARCEEHKAKGIPPKKESNTPSDEFQFEELETFYEDIENGEGNGKEDNQ